MDAEAVVQSLKDAGLPVDYVEIYSEDTDPNSLLGRPGNYTSKASFVDESLINDWEEEVEFSELYSPEYPPSPFDYGGTVEVFENEGDCKARADYLESLHDPSLGMFADQSYMYVNKNIILRISYDIAPSEAEKYEKEFMGIEE